MNEDRIDVSACVRQTANQKIKGKGRYYYNGQAVGIDLTVEEVEKLPLKLFIKIPWGTVYGMWKKHKKEKGKGGEKK